ncbi:MAG: Hpt domain-containing protein [Hyphomicrobiaceae bacterium]|nr:Hpt domain-containing protein [Hyphomicrobiaceae bacterium]
MQVDSVAPAQTPVDLEHLRRFTMGDPDLEQEILGLFADNAPKTLASLADAATAKEWLAAAHSLKGSARAIGAHAVADLAAAAEKTYPEHDVVRREQLAAVHAAIEVARDYIAQLRQPFVSSQA